MLVVGLYGLDNFYYRRSGVVDIVAIEVYTDLIISTIVDFFSELLPAACLYGLDNFYYRRCGWTSGISTAVYTDLIISTIVDMKQKIHRLKYVYTDLIISTIVDSVVLAVLPYLSIRT